MDDDRLGEHEPRLFLHFTNGHGFWRLVALDRARDERLEERRVARDRGARAKLPDQYDLITLRVVTQDAHRMAALHDIPDHLPMTSFEALHLEYIATELAGDIGGQCRSALDRRASHLLRLPGWPIRGTARR